MTFGTPFSFVFIGVYLGHELMGYDTIHSNTPFLCSPGGTLSFSLFSS